MIEQEIERADLAELEAYLQGALKDGTRSRRHRTHRIGQMERSWLVLLRMMLERLGLKGWIYREGQDRALWILETSARFLSLGFDASPLVATPGGIAYARGYFDAEGGLPRSLSARLYIQLVQKNNADLDSLRMILEANEIACGRLHVPSRRVDTDLWRFYVRASSHERFMRLVSSWHPRKRALINERLKRRDSAAQLALR